jgi:NDP-sugar pyrophosphorylase family protein
MVRPAEAVAALAFSGIHVVSPRIFGKLSEEGAFPILDAYLRLAAEGERIVAFRADGAYWRDLGRPESLLAAERDLERGMAAID